MLPLGGLGLSLDLFLASEATLQSRQTGMFLLMRIPGFRGEAMLWHLHVPFLRNYLKIIQRNFELFV